MQEYRTGFPAGRTLDTAKLADRSPVRPGPLGRGFLDSPALGLTRSLLLVARADTGPTSNPVD